MFKSILALATLAATVLAQTGLQFTSFPPSTAQAGQTYTITYMTAAGQISTPVTILLRSGPSGSLVTVADLTKGQSVTSGSFAFKVPTDVANGANYALEIEQGTTTNYTPQFAIAGASGSASSSAASSTAASSTSVNGYASSLPSTASANATITSSATAQSTFVPYPAGNGTVVVGPSGTGVVPAMGTGTSAPYPVSGSGNSTMSGLTTATSSSFVSASMTSSSTPAASTTGSSTNGASMLSGSPIALLAAIVAGLALLN